MYSNTALRRSRTPFRMNQEHSTGSRVRVTIERADQRENHGVRHRLEQKTGRPGQNINRQKTDDDHCDRINQGAVHFRRRVADHFEDVEGLPLPQGDLAEDIFDHENRAIHQDTEIDCTDGKQIGGGVLNIETDEGE